MNRGVSAGENIRKMIALYRSAGMRILPVTPSRYSENLEVENSRRLSAYCDFLRKEAAGEQIPIANRRRDRHHILSKRKNPCVSCFLLTIDRLYLNGCGNHHPARMIPAASGVEPELTDCLSAQRRQLPSMTPLRSRIPVPMENVGKVPWWNIRTDNPKDVFGIRNGFRLHFTVETVLLSAGRKISHILNLKKG